MLEDVIEELRGRQARAALSVDALRAFRRQIEENAQQLENPVAALEFIDFFIQLTGVAAEAIGRIARDLGAGVQRAHIDALRQIANNSLAEQQRCLIFRDKWINKPLPYEEMRAVLNAISTTARDQLDDFRTLVEPAASLDAPAATPGHGDAKGIDRRALFTRLFKPTGGGTDRGEE